MANVLNSLIQREQGKNIALQFYSEGDCVLSEETELKSWLDYLFIYWRINEKENNMINKEIKFWKAGKFKSKNIYKQN